MRRSTSAAERQAAARIDGLRARDDVRDAGRAAGPVAGQGVVVPGTLHYLTPDDRADFVRGGRRRANAGTRTPRLRYVEMSEDRVEQAWTRAVGDTLDPIEPMTRAVLADAIAAQLADTAMGRKLRTGWGTFLGPAAQRGELVFGTPRGQNVTFVHPSTLARVGRSRSRSGPNAGEHRATPSRG